MGFTQLLGRLNFKKAGFNPFVREGRGERVEGKGNFGREYREKWRQRWDLSTRCLHTKTTGEGKKKGPKKLF